MKCSIKDFFGKCDQIRRRKLRIWSHLLKKSWMENVIFCAVSQIISAHQKLQTISENRKIIYGRLSRKWNPWRLCYINKSELESTSPSLFVCYCLALLAAGYKLTNIITLSRFLTIFCPWDSDYHGNMNVKKQILNFKSKIHTLLSSKRGAFYLWCLSEVFT